MEYVSGEILFFQNVILVQNLMWLGATILFFITLYFGIAVRDYYVQKVHYEFEGLVFSTMKGKIFGLNRKVIVLVFAEIFFTIALAISIFLYLDPEINVFPFPSNFVAFFILLIFGYFIFSTTKQFREETYGRGFLFSKLANDFGPHKIVRLTNKKTGSIRVKAKLKGKKSLKK